MKNDCKNMGNCWKLRAYFSGDNKYMGCCDDCDEYETTNMGVENEGEVSKWVPE